MVVFQADWQMYQMMVLLAVVPVSLCASFAYVYVFVIYDSFYNSHLSRYDSFVRMNWIHYLIRSILNDGKKLGGLISSVFCEGTGETVIIFLCVEPIFSTKKGEIKQTTGK